MLLQPTEKVSHKKATSGKNGLAFPINVGLLHSYFYKAYYYYEVTFIIKLKVAYN